jgi:imidazole glycerol-phosphate synthase subunit HisH
MITIIDYGLGNIKAFLNVYERLSIPVKVARIPEEVENATKIILPGVGSFDYAMRQLNRSGIREALEKRVLDDKIPVMGICVGMQMLADSSEEGIESGLGWIKGRVCKFDANLIPFKSRLPHMGWNTIFPKENISLFNGIENQARFYFLHSYYFECDKESEVISKTDYGITYASAVNNENVFGVQFHPEKSHSYGIRLLNNFAKL